MYKSSPDTCRCGKWHRDAYGLECPDCGTDWRDPGNWLMAILMWAAIGFAALAIINPLLH
jgi:hypothetical protein